MRFAIVAAVTLLVSCTGSQSDPPDRSNSSASPSPSTTPSGQPVTDYSSFTQALSSAGFTVRDGERTDNDMLFTVDRRAVLIDGVSVSTYEYPTNKALDEARSSIGRDGYSVPMSTNGIAHVDWVASPHFYGAGTLLVLYVGDDQGTLDALREVIGPPFAGG